MRNWIIVLLLGISNLSWSATYTINYNLVKPELGDRDYVDTFAAGMDTLDTAMYNSAVLVSTWSATINALIVSTIALRVDIAAIEADLDILEVNMLWVSSDIAWTGVHSWTSSATFINADFSVDGLTLVVTTGKVGIGESAPSYKLDVNGTGRFVGSLTVDDDNFSVNVSDLMTTSGKVGIGTASPDAKLHIQDGAILAAGAVGGIPVTGAGTRFMWIPELKALRAGEINGTQWDSIGEHSTAFGSNSTASGIYSFAVGLNANATATGAIALGTNVIADNTYATAFGIGTTASGSGSFAMGYNTTAGGEYSFSGGAYSSAGGARSFAFGNYAVASFDNSFAFGNTAVASADDSIAFGSSVSAEDQYAAALGGYGNRAVGEYSTALGGWNNLSFGDYSFATGHRTVAFGQFSHTLGTDTTAQAYASVVLGRFNEIGGDSLNWVNTDPIFVIGIGASAGSRANAVTVLKNGRVGIGKTDPDYTLEVNGSLFATNLYGDGSMLTSIGLSTSTSVTLDGRVSEAGGVIKGNCLYISGATGQKVNVSKADNTLDEKLHVIGLAAEDGANNASILVRQTGIITALDTDGTGDLTALDESWSDGEAIYCSTSGYLTNSQPTSGSVQHIGHVLYAHGNFGKFHVHRHMEETQGTPLGINFVRRLGDNDGENSIQFRNYANDTIAYINSDGYSWFAGSVTVAGNGFSVGGDTLIAKAGRVGIGNNLSLNFYGDADDLVIGKGPDDATAGITIYTDNNGTGILAFADSWQEGTAQNGAIKYNQGTGIMTFRTNGASRMTISPTGVVNANGGFTGTVDGYSISTIVGDIADNVIELDILRDDVDDNLEQIDINTVGTSFSSVTATGDVSANTFYGDGSNLTGIVGGGGGISAGDTTTWTGQNEYINTDPTATYIVRAGAGSSYFFNVSTTGIIDIGGQSGCRAYMTGNSASFNSGTWTLIELNAVINDNHGEFDTTNHWFKAKYAGSYLVMVTVYFRELNIAKRALPAIYKNGSVWSSLNEGNATTSYLSLMYSDLIPLEVGDYLDLRAYHTDTENDVYIQGSGTVNTVMVVIKIW